MKWVTRERPKIDRIACPWLIARFIDEAPEFIYVRADRVHAVASATGAIPYDVDGVELGHVGALCSFDAFLKKYELGKPALAQPAAIVRGADTGRFELTPQSAGLHAVSVGLARLYAESRAAAARPDAVRGTLRLVRSAGQVTCRNARAGCAIAAAAVSAYMHECLAGRRLARPQPASQRQ